MARIAVFCVVFLVVLVVCVSEINAKRRPASRAASSRSKSPKRRVSDDEKTGRDDRSQMVTCPNEGSNDISVGEEGFGIATHLGADGLPYPNDLSCEWTFEAPSNSHRIVITVSFFQTEFDYDFVYLGE